MMKCAICKKDKPLGEFLEKNRTTCKRCIPNQNTERARIMSGNRVVHAIDNPEEWDEVCECQVDSIPSCPCVEHG